MEASSSYSTVVAPSRVESVPSEFMNPESSIFDTMVLKGDGSGYVASRSRR